MLPPSLSYSESAAVALLARCFVLSGLAASRRGVPSVFAFAAFPILVGRTLAPADTGLTFDAPRPCNQV